jgi:SPX domain protein involved in polyphosphate accumulation
MDPYCASTPQGEYGIASLYLDTANRDLFRISREHRARRWKARVRLYDGADRVFLELKSKDHDMVKKQRARIAREGWVERIHREPGPDAGPAERLFSQRICSYGLVPTLMVHYRREAWLSTVDSYARVTFDREVVAQPWSHWSFDVDESNWLALDGAHSMLMRPRGVVLELKSLTAVPRWLTNVVQSVGLVRARYSKYCKGIERHFARDTLLAVLNQT